LNPWESGNHLVIDNENHREIDHVFWLNHVKSALSPQFSHNKHIFFPILSLIFPIIFPPFPVAYFQRPKSLSQPSHSPQRPRGSGYDSGGEDRMTISDAMHYARSEFGFEADRGAGSWGLAVYMHSW